MSLLLEALKKAELAKQQGAGGPQHAGEAAAPASSETAASLTLEPQGGASAGPPLMTRDRLPDITQPLEIFTEDLAPRGRTGAPAPAPSAALELAPANPSRPAGGPERVTAQATEDAERASARQLFESKGGDYEPRRPFFLLVGALGIAVLGIAGYFAYQVLAPRPSFYSPPAAAKAPPAAVAEAPTPPAAAVPPFSAGTTGSPVAGSQGAEPPPAPPSAQSTPVPTPPQPGPGARTTRDPQRAGTPPTRPAAAVAAAAGAEPAAQRTAAPARAPVRITSSGPRVDPAVERGWEALQAGDLGRAAEEYNRALRANPADRDALLGLAAIDVRNQNFERADARYLKVLELDPRDAYAQAALIGLRGNGDAIQSESRLKTLVAQQPDSSVLSFMLGNQYASQRRWAEAQQAYFTAFSAEPENPDYAYNLAVSLDNLRQPRVALEYYQRALALAGSRPVGFNTAQAQARVRDLQR